MIIEVLENSPVKVWFSLEEWELIKQEVQTSGWSTEVVIGNIIQHGFDKYFNWLKGDRD